MSQDKEEIIAGVLNALLRAEKKACCLSTLFALLDRVSANNIDPEQKDLSGGLSEIFGDIFEDILAARKAIDAFFVKKI